MIEDFRLLNKDDIKTLNLLFDALEAIDSDYHDNKIARLSLQRAIKNFIKHKPVKLIIKDGVWSISYIAKKDS